MRRGLQYSVVSVFSVYLLPGRAAIEMLQLQSQRCLNNTLECLNWPDFLIKARIHSGGKHVTVSCACELGSHSIPPNKFDDHFLV